MAHPNADTDRHTPLTGDIHNPIDTYLPEITTPKPTTPRDSEPSYTRLILSTVGDYTRSVIDPGAD